MLGRRLARLTFITSDKENRNARCGADKLRKCLSALFIFGGDITRAEDPGGLGYRSLTRFERDKTGPMPSYERVLAGAALYKINPKLILIPSAGKSNLPGVADDAPSIASVMAAELRAQGVPAESIIEERGSYVTQEHFTNCSAIARERGWKGGEIGILTVFWHFGRIAAMMMRIQAEKRMRIEPLALGETRLISVERVLASVDEETWKELFRRALRRSRYGQDPGVRNHRIRPTVGRPCAEIREALYRLP
jgi:hypothetical protein